MMEHVREGLSAETAMLNGTCPGCGFDSLLSTEYREYPADSKVTPNPVLFVDQECGQCFAISRGTPLNSIGALAHRMREVADEFEIKWADREMTHGTSLWEWLRQMADAVEQADIGVRREVATAERKSIQSIVVDPSTDMRETAEQLKSYLFSRYSAYMALQEARNA